MSPVGAARVARNSLGGVIPASGILRYNFEQSVADEWNNNDGTNNGGAFVTNSKFGSYAIDLDGVGDYLTHPPVSVIDPAQEWSVSMFINLDTIPSSGSEGDDYLLWGPRNEYDFALIVTSGFLGSSGELIFYTYDGSYHTVQSNYTVSSGSYLHVGVSNDGTGTYDVIANGAVQNSGSIATPTNSSGTNEIGGQNSLSRRYTDGKIDRFDIYSKQLSASEWSNLDNTGDI